MDYEPLQAKELAARLAAGIGIRAEVTEQTGSTNADLLARRKAGERGGVLLAAASQTAGRGRNGRAYFCPKGAGVYFSLLLPRDAALFSPVLVTALASLAAARAAEALGAPACAIKWVNDVYCRERKCCGILVQGIYEGEAPAGIVVGFGANLTVPDGGYPEEFSARAGAFFTKDAPFLREAFAAETVNGFFALLPTLQDGGFLSEYRARSCVLGQKIRVETAAGTYRAFAEAIDDGCRLIVRDEKNILHTLSSEEVRLILA